MLKKTISLIMCGLLLLVTAFPALAEEVNDFGMDIVPYSDGVLLACMDTGQIIYEKGADERIAPASTVKIMSAALAMTLCDDIENTIVTVPDGVWNEFDGIDISCVPLFGGEQLSMYTLICAMLVPSACEASSAVASYFGYDEFIRLMNEKAAELGCTNTHFTDPHGVFTDNQYTSARDMYLITRWALTVPGFSDIVSLREITVPATEYSGERVKYTTNQMLVTTSGYYTSYIGGIKTGSLNDIKNLVSIAKKDGLTYVLVALGAPNEKVADFWEMGDAIYTDTRLIYDWAFKNLTLSPAVDTVSPVAEVSVRYASKKDAVIVYPGDTIYTVVNKYSEEEPTVEFKPALPERVDAPIKAGDVIGEAEVIFNGTSVGTIPLVAREDIEYSGFAFLIENLSMILSSKTAKIIYVILLIVVLFYIYYMAVIVPGVRKNKRKRK